MSALPTQVAENAVTYIQRDFPNWTVSRYAGFPREDDRGQPSVYVGIDTVSVNPNEDLYTGDTFADARIVALMSWRVTEAESWSHAADAAAELFGWFRGQPLHAEAQPAYPMDMSAIEELDRLGRPLRTRALWQVTASAVLTLDAVVSDAAAYDYLDIPEGAGQPDVWLTDGEGAATAGREGALDTIRTS